jgi:two-component system, chemotaxis family, CheB/CheR fusion protein
VEQEGDALEDLLEYMRSARGFDFTGYKRASLGRRIARRMHDLGIESHEAYRDYLEGNPGEFTELFDYILINVTSFFRDPAVWQYLGDEVVPRILQDDSDRPLRIWSAGCASGEEAYSIAMLFAERMGETAFEQRVKIYGTDADPQAIAQARQGIYPAKALEDVSPERRTTFFEPNGEGIGFRRDLRRALIFGQHDLVRDAPISRTDLILCRNTLMYLNADTQAGVLEKFRFSLAPKGFLVLGRSEMLFTRVRAFTSVDLKRRVFAKHWSQEDRERMGDWDAGDGSGSPGERMELSNSAFEAAPVAQMLVSAEGTITLINRHARQLFALRDADVGRRLQDLEISYRPAELRGPIEEAVRDRRTVVRTGIGYHGTDGVARSLNIEFVPLQASASGAVVISFVDVSEAERLQHDLETSKQELETAMEELQSTNEELETTNEELQSTNEELETTNEELQSTNEELETMNEELQSTNEELQSVNEELHMRTTELASTNTFMSSILGNVHAGVVVIDYDSRIQMWNQTSEDLWGLRADEVVGVSLFSLDIGLPLEPVRAQVDQLLADDRRRVPPIEVDATNRRGRPVRCRISCSLLDDPAIGGVVIMVEAEERSAAV